MKEYNLISHDTGSYTSGIINLPTHKYSRNSFKIGQKLKIKTLLIDGKNGHSKTQINCRIYALTNFLIVVEKLNKFGQAVYRTCFKYTDFETGTAEVME